MAGVVSMCLAQSAQYHFETSSQEAKVERPTRWSRVSGEGIFSSGKLWGTPRATQRWRVRPSANVSRLAVTVPGTSSSKASLRRGSSLGATTVREE